VLFLSPAALFQNLYQMLIINGYHLWAGKRIIIRKIV
jgi:hypothetical protein